MNDSYLKDILRTYKLKATDIRLRVLRIMIESKVALSHADIKDRLKDESVDKVTLYRTLASFTDNGLAHKVANEDRNWQYAVHLPENGKKSMPDADHAHFICEQCDRIFCFPYEANVESLKLSRTEGFKIATHEIRLHGTCPDCN